MDKTLNFLLLQTVSETGKVLDAWEQYLANNRAIELGGDPDVITALERDFQRLMRKLRQLEPQFNLSQMSLREVNLYSNSTKQFETTLEFVQTIRRQAFGSQRNTSQCLTKIQGCTESKARVGEIIQPHSFLLQ